MTRRNTGGILSAKEQATDANTANGVFTLSEAAALTSVGAFPVGNFAPQASAKFRSGASPYFSRTIGTPTSGSIFTHSFWLKRGSLGASQALISGSRPTNFDRIYFESDDTLYYQWNDGSSNLAYVQTTQVFRDPSAWYHIVATTDTTQAIASNRVKIYVNGVQVTALTSTTYPTQNSTSAFNTSTRTLNIGRSTNASTYLDGYLTEINFVDGQALTPSAFGRTDASTGTWVPKKYAGTYGANGFYLVPTIGNLTYDQSGNGNNFVVNNMNISGTSADFGIVDVPGHCSVTTQPDVGRVQLGNYCTVNPLVNSFQGGNRPTISEANLTISFGNANYAIAGTQYVGGTGKYYFEVNGTNVGGIYNTISFIGVINESNLAWGYQVYAGSISSTGQLSAGAYNGTGYGSGAWPVIGVAVDLSTGSIWWRNDSGWFGGGNPALGTNPAFTNLTGNITPYWNGGGGGYSGTHYFKFGATPFSYTPPDGFKSICSTNLPNPIIKRPSDHFDVKTYTGNGAQLMVGTTAKQFASAPINKSLRFKSNFNQALSRTPASAGSRTTWTWSGWVKRTTNGVLQQLMMAGSSGTDYTSISLNSTNNLFIANIAGNANSGRKYTNKLFLLAEWNHFVVVWDTTNANAYKRARIYVNGVEQSYSTSEDPALNQTSTFNNAVVHTIGKHSFSSIQYLDGYMADVHYIDGQALTPSSFGTFDANNNWAPKNYTGTYGTNGFELNFNDSRSPTTAANDVSGNSNHWTPTTVGGWNTVPTPTNAPNVLYYGTPGTYTWTAPAGVTSVTYLVVAGGAGGGGGYPTITSGGGGGAGGMLTGTLSVTPSTSYTVTVGSGGAAGAGGAGGSSGGAGTNSVFASITSTGGGYGAWNQRVGGNGGSGGGGSGPVSAGSFAGGTGTAGQGNAGGTGGQYSAGGGGGAGGVGQNAPGGSPNGQGGVGLTSSITGVSVYYAGGGGGAGALGGLGGGGTGSDLVASSVFAGTDGLGGGGGGGGNPTTTGARGGSGVVILSYTNAASYVGNGADSSNNNDSVFDSPVDTVDSDGNAVGNYATLNPSDVNGATIINGGLRLQSTGTAAWRSSRNTLTMNTGKWYAEFTPVSNTTSANCDVQIGVLLKNSVLNSELTAMTGIVYSSGDGTTYVNNSNVGVLVAAYTYGDILGVAFDADTGNVSLYKNNSLQNTSNVGTLRQVEALFGIAAYSRGGGTITVDANFGQSPFVYAPPAGFKALNTKNLKDVGSYNLPDTFGNFVNTPDLVWTKGRSAGLNSCLEDTVRGPGNILQTTTTNGNSATSGVIQFLPNGVLTGPDAGGNQSGTTFVSWMWNRGKVPGFDIVEYTGNGLAQTIRHNLGQTPAFMAVKNYTNSTNSNWMVYHKQQGAQWAANFNSTAQFGSSTGYWNDIPPGPTNFTVGSNANVSTLNVSYVAYLWAEVPGFSKMGEWTGNSSTDGPFVYCGFRPRYILLHRATDASANWDILDTARDPINPTSRRLFTESTSAELTNVASLIDFTSNGFKLRNTDTSYNSSVRYLFVAFAEAPFKYANAR